LAINGFISLPNRFPKSRENYLLPNPKTTADAFPGDQPWSCPANLKLLFRLNTI